METMVSDKKKLFQLFPENHSEKISGNIFSLGRVLIGRAESCEFVIPSQVVSAVHAVLEVTPNGAKLYDMNSRNGTYVNGKKIIVQNIQPGDSVSFGNISFVYKEYSPKSSLPPVLDSLGPVEGKASLMNTLPPVAPEIKPKVTDKRMAIPAVTPKVEEDVPYIVYPLSTDPKADDCEYIFEDADELYPIFKYEHGKQAVEVIILYKDKVYSVDYLPEKNGIYQIVGSSPKKNDVEFPYLGKDEKNTFIEIQSGNCIVSRLHNYNVTHLTDNEVRMPNEDRINLQGNDIVRLENGDLEIYVRKVTAPPKVKTAPFFRRDKRLKKLLLAVMLLIFLPLLALSRFEVDDELKKEKDPERIATILYKPKITISKKKDVVKTKEIKQQKPKVEKKVVKKIEPEKVPQKPVEKPVEPVKQVEVKKPVENPGVKTAAKTQVVKKVKNPAPKTSTTKSAAKSASNVKSATSRRATTVSNSKGHVDVYKSFNFKSTVNKLMAKGGNLSGANATGASSAELGTSSIGGGVATSLKKADVGSDIGSLTGATVGKIGESKGTEGLSAKKGIYTAGIPSETVVLGSMDPDIIRQILREHIPQFRYCYQRELDRLPGQKIADVIPLSFTIGSSGHVSRAGVAGSSRLPANVKKCVVNVLRGIQFPSPKGGGTVDVKQPMNFYPESM